MMEKIRIALVEDHTLLRETMALALAMENEFEVIGHWATGEEAMKSLKDIPFDVAIVDRVLPGIDGAVLTHRVKSKFETVHVLMLSMISDETSILEAFEAGIDGYMLKDAPISELIEGIKRIHEGETVLQRALIKNVINFSIQMKSTRDMKTLLTDEQVHVLSLAVDGLTNKEIADRVNLPLPVVKLRFREIFQKLDARHRTHAIMKAAKLGILSVDKS